MDLTTNEHCFALDVNLYPDLTMYISFGICFLSVGPEYISLLFQNKLYMAHSMKMLQFLIVNAPSTLGTDKSVNIS